MREVIALSVLLFSGLIGFSCSGATENTVEPVADTATPEPAPTLDQNDAIALLAEGNRLLDENQTQAAIDAYNRAVALDPDLADAHFQLGIAYALRDLQLQQSGVVTETPAPAVQKTKGKAKDDIPKTDSEKAFERAVKAYEKWLDANPDDHAAHFSLGRTYAKLMKDDEAAKAFKEAVKLKPDDSEYQTELGAILIKLVHFHEAIGPLKKAIELDSSNARAVDLLEEAQAGAQRMDYARKEANEDANEANANRTPATRVTPNLPGNSNAVPRPGNTNTRIIPPPPPTPAARKTP
ncbi:MAG: tetratricopeptide repeat protein [Pyrinomonadaceae bacterium]